ncbi:MAG: hypothetical protein J6U54_20220 [Clostridiales bacterium]|nr:hypothetical protein [Clostridiales bacterium]
MIVKEAYDIIKLDYECDGVREAKKCSMDCAACAHFVDHDRREEAIKRLHEFAGDILNIVEGERKDG